MARLTWKSSRLVQHLLAGDLRLTFTQEGSKRDETIVSALSLYDGLV